MKYFAILILIATGSAFYYALGSTNHDVIVTATPKGYLSPHPFVQTTWEDVIPKIEPEIETPVVKEPPPRMTLMPAIHRKIPKRWKPLRIYSPRARRLTRVSDSRRK